MFTHAYKAASRTSRGEIFNNKNVHSPTSLFNNWSRAAQIKPYSYFYWVLGIAMVIRQGVTMWRLVRGHKRTKSYYWKCDLDKPQTFKAWNARSAPHASCFWLAFAYLFFTSRAFLGQLHYIEKASPLLLFPWSRDACIMLKVPLVLPTDFSGWGNSTLIHAEAQHRCIIS